MIMLIVAEIGVNWRGDFDLLEKMLINSKTVGFDSVKFQAFNEDIIGEHPKKEELLACSITAENIEQINTLATNIGIDWFCTPMYSDAVELLSPYVKRFKIRELDGRLLLRNEITPLIQKVLNTKKDILVSVNHSPNSSKLKNSPQIKWLYCVPKYPCQLKDIDFKNIKNFDGYSNHCIDQNAIIEIAKIGAEIIELHVTQDKKGNYIDNSVSFDFVESKKILNKIKELRNNHE
jgi:sialic acid synthase SpsE